MNRWTPLLIVIGLISIFGLVATAMNPHGFLNFTGEVHSGFLEFVQSVWVGVKLIFFTAIGLGVLYALVHINRERKLIRPGRHGQVQAVIHRGQIVPLATATTVDPLQQIAYAQRMLQLAATANAKIKQVDVPEEQKQLPAPLQGIPAIIHYEDIADEIPEDKSLLGIHPGDGSLELTDWEKLKAVWLIGSSSTGKSNTIYGKALEAANRQAGLLVVDQHAVKEDSLARKLETLKHSFLRPIAVTDKEVLETLSWFKAEFERRVNGAPCSKKIVLICDEMNRMVRNEELKKPLQEIVAICGEESRGFGMYGWFISQKAAHLKWLRDSAITVIAHRVTRFEEALLACNDDRKAAQRLLSFPVGRSYIYGVDFDTPVELQQPLYQVNCVDSTLENVTNVTENTALYQSSSNQAVTSVKNAVEDAQEATGRTEEIDYSFELKKMLREAGRLRAQGVSTDAILKKLNLSPGGRNNQDLQALLDMIEEEA